MTSGGALAGQLAHPRGLSGRMLGIAMDLANRSITRRALAMLAPQRGEAILDAGCGTGAALRLIGRQADCRLSGLDPSKTMLAMAAKALGGRAELHRGKIEAHVFDAARFDAILALNVLYFAGEDGEMSRALYRWLRPGGRLVAYVTERETMEKWRFTRAGYHRLYSREELGDLLVTGGFLRENMEIERQSIGPGLVGLFVFASR